MTSEWVNLRRRRGAVSIPNELGERLLGRQSVGVIGAQHDGANTDTSATELLARVVLPAAHQQLRARFQQERFQQRQVLPHILVNLSINQKKPQYDTKSAQLGFPMSQEEFRNLNPKPKN